MRAVNIFSSQLPPRMGLDQVVGTYSRAHVVLRPFFPPVDAVFFTDIAHAVPSL